MKNFPSLERFRGWLQRRGEDEILAKDWNTASCPLCLFLRQHGCDDPEVTPTRWSADSLEADKPLPSWAREVVMWIDRIRPRVVTAGEMLFILDQPFFKPDRWN